MIGFYVLAAVVAADVVLFVTLKHDVRTLGYVLLVIGFVALPWNAVTIPGFPLADVPIFAGTAILSLEFLLGAKVWLPKTLLIGVALLVLAGLLSEVLPPSAQFLSSRIDVASFDTFNPLNLAARNTDDLLNLAKYLVAVAVLPVVAVIAVHDRPRRVQALAYAWLGGIAISSAVAVTDHLGVTHISSSLIGFTDISGRQPGLSVQPNHLGVQIVMGVPLAVYLWSRGRRALSVGYLILGFLGLYVAASRGAVAAAVVALLLAVLVQPGVRRHAGAILYGTGVAALVYAMIGNPEALLSKLRLTASVGTAVSDSERSQLRHQAVLDWQHSPLFGIGYGHANDGHVIFLQVLAAGGLIALAGFLFLTVGTMYSAWRGVTVESSLARALIASTAAWLVIGLVENQLTDQYLYVPIALVVALWAAQRRAEPSEIVLSDRSVVRRERTGIPVHQGA